MFSNQEQAKRPARFVRALVLATTLALVPAVGVVAAAPAAHAEGGSKEWTGEGSGGLWSDDNNWSGNEAPKEGDSVSIHSPDSKGSVVHVVGAPDISLDSLSITADGTAAVSLTGGDISVGGTFDWTSGTLQANVSLGPLAHGTIGSGGAKFLQGDISAGLGSALLMTGVSGTSGLMMYGPHTISISYGAAFATIGDNRITAQACCVNPAKFINNGLMEQGPGTFELSMVEFDQLARLDATFGPTLKVDSAPVKIANGARFSGTGRTILGASTASKLAGTIKIGGSYVLEQAGGTLEGNATLTNGGTYQFTGGTQYGTLTNALGNLLQITGTTTKTLGGLSSTARGNIVNHGVVEASGGELAMASGTKIVNAEDGTLRLVPGLDVSGLSCCVSPALIENHGDLTVTAPATDGEPVVPVTIDRAALYSNAPVTISPGQTLELANGPSELSAPATVGGGGTLGVADDLIVDNTVPVQASSVVHLHGAGANVIGNGAVFGGPGSTVQWDSGAIGGHVTFPAGTTVDLRTGGTKYVAAPPAGSTILTTAGTTTLEAGPDAAHRNELNVGPGQRWVNTGTLTVGSFTALSANSCCVTPARLENAAGATLTFAPDAGTTVEDTGVELHNLGGTVTASSGIVNLRYPSYVQEDGTTTVASGATFGQTNSSPMQLLGGTVTGTGTLTGTVANTGATVAPGASAATGSLGTLSVAGAYYQGPGGHLHVDVTPSANDVLASSGEIRMAGVVTGVIAGGQPKLGRAATVVTGSVVNGTPDCTFTTGSTTRQWSSSRTSSTLVLTAGAPAPTGCDVVTPVDPARIDGSGTAITPTRDVVVQITGIGGIPSNGVDAVALTVSVDGAAGDGALIAGAAGAPRPTGEVVRFHAGQPVSNTSVVRVDAQGRVRLHVNGAAATVHLDIAGWYGDAQQTAGGSLFHAVTPQLVRTASVSAGTDVDVVIGGKGGVPSTGVASVTVALEITSGATAGSLSVLPGGATVGDTVTQSFGAKEKVEALATVVPKAGKIRLHLSTGTAKVAIRTLGYTTPRAQGGSYLKLAGPSRVDSFVTSDASTTEILSGIGGISQYGAVAYILGVHAEDPSAKGVLSVGSAENGATLVPAVSLRAAHADASGATVTTGSAYNALRYRTGSGSTMTRVDLQGWYVG